VSRTIPIPDRPALVGFSEKGDLSPDQARLNLDLSRAQFDMGNLSSAELAKIEQALNPQARNARTIYNPFTGEVRKVFL
jgi:hypothetical protein